MTEPNRIQLLAAEARRLSQQVRREVSYDDSELRESLKTFGWLDGEPAEVDEHGNVIKGHRRLRIAEELGIEPKIKVVSYGSEADRNAEAQGSNIATPRTKAERQRIVRLLYEQRHPETGHWRWSVVDIARTLGVERSTAHQDINNTGGTRGGGDKLTPEQEQEISALVAQGESSSSVAERFHVHPRTVDWVAQGATVKSWSAPLNPPRSDRGVPAKQTPSASPMNKAQYEAMMRRVSTGYKPVKTEQEALYDYMKRRFEAAFKQYSEATQEFRQASRVAVHLVDVIDPIVRDVVLGEAGRQIELLQQLQVILRAPESASNDWDSALAALALDDGQEGLS